MIVNPTTLLKHISKISLFLKLFAKIRYGHISKVLISAPHFFGYFFFFLILIGKAINKLVEVGMDLIIAVQKLFFTKIPVLDIGVDCIVAGIISIIGK